MNRTLTQKYDMTSLRALQVLESKFLGELAAVYSVPEDDVPVELDLLCIYNMDASLRLKAVVSSVINCSVSEVILFILRLTARFSQRRSSRY